jgi:hypothetical protein
VSVNGNETHPCADCGRLSAVVVVSMVVLNGKRIVWQLCGQCEAKRWRAG